MGTQHTMAPCFTAIFRNLCTNHLEPQVAKSKQVMDEHLLYIPSDAFAVTTTDEETIKVVVQVDFGGDRQSAHMKFRTSDFVNVVKLRVHECMPEAVSPPIMTSVLYNGHEMGDFTTLGDHEITSGATLTLIDNPSSASVALKLCEALGVAHVDDERQWCLCTGCGTRCAKCDNGGAKTTCTALCWYAMTGRTRMVKALVAAQADVNKPGTQGHSPLWLASHFGHEYVASILQAAGAKHEDQGDKPQIRRHVPVPCGQRPACVNDTFELQHKIGVGQCGSVWKAVHRHSGHEVAVKLIRKSASNPDHPTADREIDKELAAMQRVADAHCVKLYEVYETEHEVQLVLEFMPGYALFQHILAANKNRTTGGEGIPEAEVKQIMRQTILGVKAVHDKHVIHRDLKAENILVCGEGKTFKLGDFGLAKVFAEETETETPAALERTSSQVGTPGYAAPELLEGVPYSYAADVWSLGVIAYTALSGCTPFPLDMKPSTVQRILKASYEFPARCWDTRSSEAQDFVRCMLQRDPDSRPTLDELLAHPWLQSESTTPELAERLDQLGHQLREAGEEEMGLALLEQAEASAKALAAVVSPRAGG